jgi:hypothetical protein
MAVDSKIKGDEGENFVIEICLQIIFQVLVLSRTKI